MDVLLSWILVFALCIVLLDAAVLVLAWGLLGLARRVERLEAGRDRSSCFLNVEEDPF